MLVAGCVSAHAQPVKDALAQALRGTQASAVVLDTRTGAVLASVGKASRATPGSAVKPLLLEYALEHNIVNAELEVYCRRNLHVGGRALPCTHPADHPVFTAESAVAESCNTWFAELARRYSGPELEAALNDAHLPHAPMVAANVEQRQLAVLGLVGVTTSPLELAMAYRDLFERMPPTGPVALGLKESVSYGMANPAAVPGVTILGKTGTASDVREAWTHGWFAGGIPGRVVIVIYVPHGDGGTSAALARKFFASIAGEGTP
jgi:cell division protein FtsI/penicillin-binding protein 2